MLPRFTFLLLCLATIAACRPGGPTVFSATVPRIDGLQAAAAQSRAVTAVPTINRQPSRTPTPTATETPLPSASPTATRTPTPERTAIPIHSPAPGSAQTDEAGTPTMTWTPPPPDPATQIDDHYRMRRPIPDGNTNWVDRTYPYGGTQGGNLAPHTGVEFVNPRGIPILAVADGTVYYAGHDTVEQFGPMTSYYGRLVVIEHEFRTAQGEPVFSLYGHIERWDVETGDHVTQGQQIGIVGGTGIAQGPHLHFEVRVGDPRSVRQTRNPELWIVPFQGFGTLAGRVTDANGQVLYSAPIQVRNANLARYAFTYADDSVNPDSEFGENFTLGDLPANYYEVSVTADGRVRFRQWVYVYPNRTTWIDIRLDP